MVVLSENPAYGEKEWFERQIGELDSKLTAMYALAKAHGFVGLGVKRKRHGGETLKESAFQVLSIAKREMTTDEIRLALIEMGHPPGGRRPNNTLCATLTQDGRTVAVGRALWGLVSAGEVDKGGDC